MLIISDAIGKEKIYFIMYASMHLYVYVCLPLLLGDESQSYTL